MPGIAAPVASLPHYVFRVPKSSVLWKPTILLLRSHRPCPHSSPQSCPVDTPNIAAQTPLFTTMGATTLPPQARPRLAPSALILSALHPVLRPRPPSPSRRALPNPVGGRSAPLAIPRREPEIHKGDPEIKVSSKALIVISSQIAGPTCTMGQPRKLYRIPRPARERRCPRQFSSGPR